MSSLGILYSDIHQDFVSNAQGDFKISYNIDAIETSIDNILRTSKSERVMLRSFGSRIKSLLFDPIDESLYAVAIDEIKESISKWDNRVLVRKVNIKTDRRSENIVGVEIVFAIKGYDNIFSYNASLQITGETV